MWRTAWGDGRTDIGPPASCCFCCRFHSFLTGRQDGDRGGAYSTVHLGGVTERDRRGRRRANRSNVPTRNQTTGGEAVAGRISHRRPTLKATR